MPKRRPKTKYNPAFVVIHERPARTPGRGVPKEPLTVRLLETAGTGDALFCEVNGYDKGRLAASLRARVWRHGFRSRMRSVDGGIVVWAEPKESGE